jgi:hypothetical protein
MNCVEQAATATPPAMPADDENGGEITGMTDAHGSVDGDGKVAAVIGAAGCEGRGAGNVEAEASGANEAANVTAASVGTQANPVPTDTLASVGVTDRQHAAAQSLGDLLTVGATFLHELGQSLRQNTTSETTLRTAETTQDTAPTAAAILTSLIATDETTGQRYVKLPLPQNTEPLLRLTELLQTILRR